MAKVTGRADDMLVVRGVNLVPTQTEELILRCSGLWPHYAVELTRPNRMDATRVIAEARQGVTPLATGKRRGR